MPEIVYDNVSLAFNGSAVSGISFHIKESEHACICGPIGAGKSLLLRSIVGQVPIKKGSFYFLEQGELLDDYALYKLGHLIEFTKSSKYFNPAHHFYQQRYHHQMEDDEFSKSVTISTLLSSNGVAITDDNIRSSLIRADLIDRTDTKLIQLSNGQRKKLQLIVALMKKSHLLLLDSPHLGLDAESRVDLNNWLFEVAQQNDLQIIMCTDERDIPDWISNKIELSAGRTASKQPEAFEFIHRINEGRAETNNSVPSKVFELENLNLSFGEKDIFNDVSWRVRPGERIALIGKNGCGKSTMMSFLYADNPRAYSSMLRMFGVQRGKGDNIWDVKRRIGFVSSEFQIYFTESISCKKVIATGFFDTKFVQRKLTDQQEVNIRVFAEYFEVLSLLERNFQHISYGEQRLMLLIRSLVKIPELLLLDEPYQGFDSSLIQQSNALIDYLVRRFNITLIFISHYEDELPECIDRKLVLEGGKLVKI